MRDKLKLNAAAVIRCRRQAWFWPSSISALAVFGGFVTVCGLLVWLGEPASGENASNLGSVLEAQAAMTAIFLAAMIFIVEAVQRREGLDDPLYELFLSKSWARWTFATAVWLLIGTALLYATGPISGFLGELADARGDVLGILSLVFAALLVLAFLLRALHVLRPEQYRELRRDAVLSQVRRGAKSQAQARKSESSQELIRQLTGSLNNEEAQATRTIERVVDQTFRAVEQAQLTDVREGVDLLERICLEIGDELERGGVEIPEIGTPADRRWLGHDNVFAGLQRLIRGAAVTEAGAPVLRAILCPDVQRTQTTFSPMYRLRENVIGANELFVQITLECQEEEWQTVTMVLHGDPSDDYKSWRAEMLSSALRLAVLTNDSRPHRARWLRIARRVIRSVHESACGAALQGDLQQASELFEILFRHAESVFPTSEQTPAHEDSIRIVLRQAMLSGIGYAVVTKNDALLQAALRDPSVKKLVDAGRTLRIYEAMRTDANQCCQGNVLLEQSLWTLGAVMASHSGREVDSALYHEMEHNGVAVGYMWLLAVIQQGNLGVSLPNEVRHRFDIAWRLHGEYLVSALRQSGIGEGRDLQGWCQAVFGDDQGEPKMV